MSFPNTINKTNTVLKPGDRVRDTYVAEKYMGRGCFGEVYRVKHPFFGRQVMKIITNEKVYQNGFNALAREAIILSSLTHPNIVRLFEANTLKIEGKERFFMVMEHVSGESLERLLEREGALDISTAISLMKDICRGLAAAHSRRPPVIHRDIKATNILISYDDPDHPYAKVADFGVAAAVDSRTRLGYSDGALICMAPEAIFDIATTASDVFSAGILFYEMLAGKHPWKYEDTSKEEHEDNRASIIAKVRMIAPERIDEINKACPKDIADIIAKMLIADRKARFRDAGEVMGTLDGVNKIQDIGYIRSGEIAIKQMPPIM